MLQKSGGHQFIWLSSLKQTARTWNTVVGFDEFPFKMASEQQLERFTKHPMKWRVFFHHPNRLAEFSSINCQKQKWWKLLTLDFGVQRGSFNHEDLSENCYFVTRQRKQSFTKSACHLWSSFTSSNLFQSAAKATPQHVPWHPCTCGRSLASPRKSMPTRVVSQHTASPASKDHASSMHLPNWALRTLYHQGAWS